MILSASICGQPKAKAGLTERPTRAALTEGAEMTMVMDATGTVLTLLLVELGTPNHSRLETSVVHAAVVKASTPCCKS